MAAIMADSGVVYEEEYIHNSRGMKLFTCRWLPAEKEIKALIFLCHGYAMECSNYTRETGMRLAKAGYAVYGVDYEGHGKSEGLQCYVPNFDQLVADCEAFFKSILDREEYVNKPRFIYGESMGGAVAILVSQRNPRLWSGLVLLAPMCKISDKIKPAPIITSILKKVSRLIPTWKIVPSKSVIDNAYKDPIKREEIRSNPMAYQGQPRLRTAVEMLRASTELEKNLDKVTLPFLCLHGEEDTVTEPEVSKALYVESASFDKTLKMYPGMWHGLTTGEPDQNVETVFEDITTWLDKRAQDAEAVTSPQLRSFSLTPFDSKLGAKELEMGLQAQHDSEFLQRVTS